MMDILTIPVGSMQNLVYLLTCPTTNQSVVVDCGFDHENIIQSAKKITYILATHRHFDHIQEIPALQKKTHAKVYIHSLELSSLPGALPLPSTLQIGTLHIKIIHTPGHTEGSCCFLIDNKLFTGDTLFVEGCGRTDLPGGNTAKLFESLHVLRQLPDATEVYPAHDYGTKISSSIGYEKIHNRFMRADKETFLHIR